MLAVVCGPGQQDGAALANAIIFVALLAVGGAGAAGLWLPGEAGIVARCWRWPAAGCPRAPAALGWPDSTGGFALLHGLAHGAEMPASASAGLYGAGFMAASAALHLAAWRLPCRCTASAAPSAPCWRWRGGGCWGWRATWPGGRQPAVTPDAHCLVCRLSVVFYANQAGCACANKAR